MALTRDASSEPGSDSDSESTTEVVMGIGSAATTARVTAQKSVLVLALQKVTG